MKKKDAEIGLAGRQCHSLGSVRCDANYLTYLLVKLPSSDIYRIPWNVVRLEKSFRDRFKGIGKTISRFQVLILVTVLFGSSIRLLMTELGLNV